jgi:signal transduction histidine kinase
MKSASAASRKHQPTFSENYSAALAAYLAHPDEAALRQAYELGRESMTRGTSLVELAIAHQEAFATLLRKSRVRSPADRLVPLASEFLAEVLSPFDMANRGFQDAVSALRKMNELLEDEIKRIAYAVHDEAGQILVAVHLALSNLKRRSSPQLHEDFQNVSLLLRQVESQLRQYSHELRPTILDDLGLIPAVRFLAGSISKRAGLPIRVSAEFAGRLAPANEIALYRILQEALNNAVKHARASSVSIHFLCEKNLFVCKVQDDGIGFDPSIVRKPGRIGLGLVSMQERINAVGGTFQLESSSGRGACLVFRVPMNSLEVNNARTHSSRG